ncbi:MAG TPA: Rid family detoxifying hydrolase [Acidobacteriota bacterium]|nr:Rid family detoxifying hydrolase [Acidobacteriota bacterium]
MPEKKKIAPPRGPQAVGPYSPAIRTDGLIFVSGQVAINPDSQEIERGTIQQQVDRIMHNLSLILEAAGSSLERVVKASVFLADMNDFEAMNETYGKYFKDPAPARTTIEVSRLPKDVDVEIDVIALAG